MRRVEHRIALVLTVLLLAGLTAGCGAGQAEEPVATAAVETESPLTEQQPAAVEEPAPEVTAAVLPTVETAFDETVLVDNDDIAVTVTEFAPNSQLGPAFTVLLENKTEAALYFTLANVSVNDVMIDPIWGENVPAGESLYSYIYWYPEDLLSSGINYVEHVDATLWVYHREDHTEPDIYEDAVSWAVANSGTDQPSTRRMVYDGSFEPVEILNGDLVAYLVDYTPEGEWGPALTLYLENNGGETVLLAMVNTAVNGVACDPYWNLDVTPGKIAYSTCFWWAEDLEALGIDEIETVEFTFLAVDHDDFKQLASVTMTVSVAGDGELLAGQPATVTMENGLSGSEQDILLPGA